MSHVKLPGRLAIAGALVFSLSLQAGTEGASPDEIVLKDGSRILGTVTGVRDGLVTVETGFAGAISVQLEQVESLQASDPAIMLLADDSVLRDQPLQIEGEQLLVATAAGTEQQRALADLKVVNPEPWELGEGYRWSGLVNLAFKMERGNTDTDELDYKLETEWRSTRDRYTLKWRGEIDEANGEKNTDNWNASGKYDYFLTGPNYWGFTGRAEEDKFADIDLRYVIGPHIGRTFYEEPIFTLSGELGVAYVDENFIVAEDQDYPAATWALDTSSNYLGGDSRMYLNQYGIWNLDETSDVIINTTIGLAFPLLWNFEAAAEVLLEYDSGATDDIEELDETYNLRIGYTW